MNPSLLEYFAAHEQLSAQDMRNIHATISDDLRASRDNYEDEVASRKASLRFIRARAMVEEAEKQQPVNKDMPMMDKCPFHDTWRLGGDCQFCRKQPNPIHKMFHEAVEESGILKPKTTGLSFSEALVAMKEGKMARRKAWADCAVTVTSLGKVAFFSPEGHISSATMNHEDILADNWEVVP